MSMRATRRAGLAWGFVAALAAGCSGGDEGGTGKSIDCTWFTGPNCWREVVDAAYACTNDAQGTFDAARSACAGTDVSVAFADPVPADLFGNDSYLWDLTVTRGGAECVHVKETAAGLEVTSSAGQFRQEVEGTTMVFVCPGGDRYSIGAFAALDCGFDVLPGYAYSESSSTLSYQLLGAGDHGGAPLFTCGASPAP